MRYCAHKHLLAQIWQFKSHSDLENVISMQIWLKSANPFMRYGAHKHFLAEIWQFKSHSDLEN